MASNLVNNGVFDDDSVWSWGNHWSWRDVELDAEFSHGYLQDGVLSQQVDSLVAGRKYKVKFDIVEYTGRSAGYLYVRLGGTNSEQFTAAQDDVEIELTAGQDNLLLEFAAVSSWGTSGHIVLDNVELYTAESARPLVGGSLVGNSLLGKGLV